MAIIKTSGACSHCSIVVHQRKMLKPHCNAIQSECLFNSRYEDVIRRETTSVFVRAPVDNCMFTSQPTSPPWLSATCSEHSNNFDLTTGLNRVCSGNRGKFLQRVRSCIYLWEESIEINRCCTYSWPLLRTEVFQNQQRAASRREDGNRGDALSHPIMWLASAVFNDAFRRLLI